MMLSRYLRDTFLVFLIIRLLEGDVEDWCVLFVQVGTIHKNRANRRKSRLAFAKKSVEVALGLYTPPPPPEVRAASSKVADEDQADKVTVVSV